MNTNDFLQGALDCQQGTPSKVDASDDYNRGYSAQYSFEQVQDYITGKQDETLRIKRAR